MPYRISKYFSIVMSIIINAMLYTNAGLAFAQADDFELEPYRVPCSEHDIQAIVWSGSNPKMNIGQLVAYCGPILWFSPDEPILAGAEGSEILFPEPFPFEEDAAAPVVYYRLRTILIREDADGPAYIPHPTNKDLGVIDLYQAVGIEMDYFFYYRAEHGMGSHEHDVESVRLTLQVWRRDDCQDNRYNLVVKRIVGKAHGVHWYDNILEVDEQAKFPMHILVEEGKHASCPDKNGDGYFTPGYDVNKRVNDAWGVRDVMRTGTLFTSSYQSWMTKLRRKEHRVFPPLPEDSPLREEHSENGVYSPLNAIYVLRPFPSAENADPGLRPFIAGKGDPNWPEEKPYTDLTRLQRWAAEAGSFVKSLSIAFRADGDLGVSIIFPFFVVKHLQEPFGGGWVVNRIYFKDTEMRDFAWTVLYTKSASRWMEGYFSAGFEWDEEWTDINLLETFESTRNFVLETGVKFRADLSNTPMKFLTKITDFWGLRLGIKSTGFVNVDRLSYVIEVGAGSW